LGYLLYQKLHQSGVLYNGYLQLQRIDKQWSKAFYFDGLFTKKRPHFLHPSPTTIFFAPITEMAGFLS